MEEGRKKTYIRKWGKRRLEETHTPKKEKEKKVSANSIAIYSKSEGDKKGCLTKHVTLYLQVLTSKRKGSPTEK